MQPIRPNHFPRGCGSQHCYQQILLSIPWTVKRPMDIHQAPTTHTNTTLNSHNLYHISMDHCEEKATSATTSSSLPPRRKKRLVRGRGCFHWNDGQQCSSFLLHGLSYFQHHISNVATYTKRLLPHLLKISSPPILKKNRGGSSKSLKPDEGLY